MPAGIVYGLAVALAAPYGVELAAGVHSGCICCMPTGASWPDVLGSYIGVGIEYACCMGRCSCKACKQQRRRQLQIVDAC